MRMLRVYRICTYFGKLGKRWSDVVLFAGVLALFGANITFLTLWIVLGSRNGIKIVNAWRFISLLQDYSRLHSTKHYCIHPSYMILLLIAILNKKYPTTILQRHKESQYIHLLGYSSYTLLPLAQVISDDRIHVYLMFASVNSTAILCQTFLFLPKCLPSLLRHINWSTITQDLKANRKEILYSHQWYHDIKTSS